MAEEGYMKRNLFIIDDYVDPQKDAIYQTLKNKKKDYLFLNDNLQHQE